MGRSISLTSKRKYFNRFSVEEHRTIITRSQLQEIYDRFYLTDRELAYLFGIRYGTMKKIRRGEMEMPFLIQLALYYLMQDPQMIYKLIKDLQKYDKAKENLERQAQAQ